MDRYESAKRLVRAVVDISAQRSLDGVQNIVKSAARDLARADGATFTIRDGEFCYYTDEVAIHPLWKGRRLPVKSCMAGWVMLNRRPAMIEDIHMDKRMVPDVYEPGFVKSVLLTPIHTVEPIGAISVYWKQRHSATTEEIELLQALADVTAVGMENLKLLTELRGKVRELEAATRSKDEFLMTLSHELRTPLNAILGWSHLLEAGVSDEHELRQGLETIARNAKSEEQIVDDLLDESQILMGKLKLEARPFDLVSAVRDFSREARARGMKKRLAIEFEACVPKAWVVGDFGRICQIVENLLSNAIKFSREEGRIWVRVDRQGPCYRVQVRDEGEGINPEFLPYIFDRFRQSESSPARRFGGLGLGLSIAQQLARAHQGTIRAESKGKGRGAVFTLELPIADVESKEEQEISLVQPSELNF